MKRQENSLTTNNQRFFNQPLAVMLNLFQHLPLYKILKPSAAKSFGRAQRVQDDIVPFILFLFFLLLPTQLGKHFFFPVSFIAGVRIDYLAPTLYTTDILFFLLFFFFSKAVIQFFR